MIQAYSKITQSLLGTLFTWGLTLAGSGVVFFLDSSKQGILDASLGFAAGVMLAASYWSLLEPALSITSEDSQSMFGGNLSFIPIAIGFTVGAYFVFLMDKLLPAFNSETVRAIDVLGRSNKNGGNELRISLHHQHQQHYQSLNDAGPAAAVRRRMAASSAAMASNGVFGGKPGDYLEAIEENLDADEIAHRMKASQWKRIVLLALAVTMHNIPEGLAVGVGFGAQGSSSAATFQSARNLAIGIGIQNFPEGLAVSLPLHAAGYSKWKAFWYGQLSGVVEPVAGVFGCYMIQMAQPLLPYALAFAAGAMIFVVVDDIIPEAQTRLGDTAWIWPLVNSHWWFAACCGLLAPFYPNLADKKGIPPTKYSYVFSIYRIGMLVGSFSADFVATKSSGKLVYLAALWIFYFCQLLIGNLYWIEDPDIFLNTSYAIAFFAGINFSWYMVTLNCAITKRFVSQVGVLIAIFEALWGIGSMVGSAVGGLLIDLWAFPLPFVVLGTLMIFLTPYVCIKGLTQGSSKQKESPINHSDLTYKRLFTNRDITIDLFTVFCYWIVGGFHEPTLEPYLRETFDMGPTELGYVFTVQYAIYCFAAPLAGFVWYCGHLELYMIFIQLACATSFMIIGPVSFLPWKPSLGLVYSAQVLLGIGLGGLYIGGYTHAVTSAIKAGFPDNLQTHGIISTWVAIFTCAGAIISPPVAAKLVEVFGYRTACIFPMTGMAFWALPLLWRHIKNKKLFIVEEHELSSNFLPSNVVVV